jgi:F-type H+-transporting ATPase subunit b
MDVLTTLGIDGWSFLWHTINFVVLIGLLTKFLYTPVISLLDERTRRIEESLAAAEQARAQVAQADAERDELLASARRERQELLMEAQQIAERLKAEARTAAQQEAERIVESARQEADAERTQVMAELKREVASLAVQAAERIISKSLDDQAHRQLVEDFLDEQPASAGRA